MRTVFGITGAIAPSPVPAEVRTPERRETSGVTSRLILSYVERERGREGSIALLEHRRPRGDEEPLRDENHWFSWEKKIALLDAAAEVLDDPEAGRRIGAAGLDFNLAQGVKLSLRALGTPRLIYKNIVRASTKFTLTHRMEADRGRRPQRADQATSTSPGAATTPRLRPEHRLPVSAPVLFGLPPARVSHPVCARDGGDACVYDIRWEDGASRCARRSARSPPRPAARRRRARVRARLRRRGRRARPRLLGLAGVRESRFRDAPLQAARAEGRAQRRRRPAPRGSLHDLVSELASTRCWRRSPATPRRRSAERSSRCSSRTAARSAAAARRACRAVVDARSSAGPTAHAGPPGRDAGRRRGRCRELAALAGRRRAARLAVRGAAHLPRPPLGVLVALARRRGLPA